MNTLVEQYQQLRENLSPTDSSLFDPIQDTTPIVSDGDIDSSVMTIARDLGYDEVQQRKPLIGKAGQLYRKVLNHYDIESYMTNLVPYKPNGNTAFPSSIRDRFAALLVKQIDLVKPDIILTLGREALEFVLGRKISSVMRELENYYLNERFSSKYSMGSAANLFWSKEHSFYFYPMLHPSYFARKGISADNVIDYVVSSDRDIEFKHYFNLPLMLARRKLNEL